MNNIFTLFITFISIVSVFGDRTENITVYIPKLENLSKTNTPQAIFRSYNIPWKIDVVSQRILIVFPDSVTYIRQTAEFDENVFNVRPSEDMVDEIKPRPKEFLEKLEYHFQQPELSDLLMKAFKQLENIGKSEVPRNDGWIFDSDSIVWEVKYGDHYIKVSPDLHNPDGNKDCYAFLNLLGAMDIYSQYKTIYKPEHEENFRLYFKGMEDVPTDKLAVINLNESIEKLRSIIEQGTRSNP